MLCLKRFQMAGHKPVALVGGATGLIGDPSFKAAERKLNTEDTVQEWVDKIRKQVAPFLDFNCGENSAIAANNYDWFGSMNVLTFLRDIGKHFSVNQMINKEAVKQRLNRDDQGISFTEFSYNLLQGYDFACLNKLHGVSLQIGGSDQWGNITSGIDLTRRLHQNQVFGLTVPLITKADGTKFGKTEGGAVPILPQTTSKPLRPLPGKSLRIYSGRISGSRKRQHSSPPRRSRFIRYIPTRAARAAKTAIFCKPISRRRTGKQR